MKTEMEIAMKLLEKDTHEKQDTLVALRQQLEEVKAINLQMFHKVQVGIGFVFRSQPGFLQLGYRGRACHMLRFGPVLLLQKGRRDTSV